MVVARYFGAEAATDAFFVAFKIPNFLRRLFAEGAFSQAFVPVFTEFKTRSEHDEVKRFAGAVAGTLGGVLLIVTLIGVIAAPALIAVFAPGFWGDEVKFELATSMLRLTFPYLFFIALTAFCGSMLNAYGRFGVPALTPVWLNIVLIGAALGLTPWFDIPVYALAWGVFIAGIVQLVFQLPFLYKMDMLPRPTWGWRNEGVQRVLKLMIPAIFGSSVAQINLLLDTIIASFLVTGSVSWLYYSDRLVEFPLGVFGIALATVILPHLSAKHAEASSEAFSQTIDWALRWTFLFGVPAALGLAILAEPVLATLFQYGEFSAHDVRMSGLSLSAMSIGLVAFILVKILAPGFYARQNTRTPVKIGIIAMVANMGLNIAIVVPMVLLGVAGPHAGLALATTLSAFLNAGMLWRQLRKEGAYMPAPGWARLGAQITAAAVLMVSVVVALLPDLSMWSQWRALERLLNLLLLISAGAVTYAAAIWLLGVRGDTLRRLLRHR